MRSEQQHIDEFFQYKEELHTPETGDATAGWQSMQTMLKPATQPGPKSYRIEKTRRIIKYLGGFTVVTIITLVSLYEYNKHRKAGSNKSVAATTTRPASKQTTSGNDQSSATGSSPATKTRSGATATRSGQTTTPRGIPSAHRTGSATAAHTNATYTTAGTSGRSQSSVATNNSRPVTPGVKKQADNTTGTSSVRNNTNNPPVNQDDMATVDAAGSNNPVNGNTPPPDNGDTDPPIKDQPAPAPGTAELQLNTFYDQLRKEGQTFSIDPSKDTVITAKEGTKLTIKANSFALRNGPVKRTVQLVIHEYYTYDDILAGKLTTTAGGEQLISGGMVHLSGTVDNQPVTVASGKTIDLQMPAPKPDERMQLFSGIRTSLKPAFKAKFMNNTMIDTVRYLKNTLDEHGDINWTPEGQEQKKAAWANRTIRLLKIYSDPYRVTSRNKVTGYFYVAPDCPLSNQQMADKLKTLSQVKYDEVKVKRIKPNAYAQMKLDREPIAGDSVNMLFTDALKRNLITSEDSLVYMKGFQKDSIMEGERDYFYTYYNFKVNKLGYFNCDRYNREAGSSVEFTCNPGEGFDEKGMVSQLIFKNYRSVLKGTFTNNRIVFEKIPPGQPVQLVTIGIRNGRVMSCIKDLVTDKMEVSNLSFVETTPQQFREKLKELAAGYQ